MGQIHSYEREKMNNYRVHIIANFYFNQQAKTKDEAVELAKDFYMNNDPYEFYEDPNFNADWDIVDIYPSRLTKEERNYGQ